MTMQVINYQSFNKLNDQCVPAGIGDALFISGGLLHEIPHDVTYLSMTFVDKDFVLSYDDRCVISDVFYSQLPKRLLPCLRCDSIYIMENKNRDFKLDQMNYISYII